MSTLTPGSEHFDGFIYICGCEPTDWAPNPPLVKIGWAKDTDHRVESFRIGSPLKLKVLMTFPGSRRMESWLHANFADRREHGEWFRMAADAQLERIEAAVDRYTHGDDRSDCVIEELDKPSKHPDAKRIAQAARANRTKRALTSV